MQAGDALPALALSASLERAAGRDPLERRPPQRRTVKAHLLSRVRAAGRVVEQPAVALAEAQHLAVVAHEGAVTLEPLFEREPGERPLGNVGGSGRGEHEGAEAEGDRLQGSLLIGDRAGRAAVFQELPG